MKKYLRFDSVGGASGDMILSALAALGADLSAVEAAINRFFPEPVHLHAAPASAAGLNGLRVTVHAEHPHHDAGEWPDAHGHGHAHDHAHGHGHHAHGHHGHAHRGLAEIAHLLEHAPLTDATRALALAVFRTLAEAEAKIHGKTPETVHFHEVGAWDSVADIVGSCLALEQLGVCGVACGPLPAGTGTIRCAHGEMPNPAPATQELLAGMVVAQTDEPFELVTPTGAALLRVWTRTLEPVPAELSVVRSAFGFGGRTLNGRPNVLRATLFAEVEAAPVPPAADAELEVLETNLDDCNPEWLGTLTADLLERGALDVWYTPAVMKKGRPGTVLSVLAEPPKAAALREWIFRSTTTFGIRSYAVRRETLSRRFENVSTPWGEVPVKVGSLRGEEITRAPEHNACALLALAHGIAPRQVYEAAKQALKR
jgi:uncharacterized protein (TIGR00299 family) protein